MSKAAVSIYVWAIYVVLLGLGITFIPNTIVGIFGLPPTDEFWIRMMGIILILLGYYYYVAVKGDFEPIYRASVPGRVVVVGAGVVFVLLGMVKVNFLIILIMDVLGAAWTWWALRQD